jgi:CNT family concentrative nucleoside transporter
MSSGMIDGAARLQSLLGLFAFAAVAWSVSEHRRGFPVRIVVTGMALQVGIALIMFRFPLVADLFLVLNRAVEAIQESTLAGTSFVFGFVGGGDAPYETVYPHAAFSLAFQALPLVLVISALSSVLFYWGVLPKIVKGFSWLLEKSLKIGGAEGLGISANIFVGMVEAPLLIRPYIARLTRSELFTLMTCGMATIAGTVMVLYAGILDRIIPNVIGHILTASIISAPAAIVISKIMIPETAPLTSGQLTLTDPPSGAMDAVTRGTTQGLELMLNIIAMIIVLVALVHLINIMLGAIPDMAGAPLTLQRLMGWLMCPVVWLMGVPWAESHAAGVLMGTKTVLNEFIAYVDMSNLSPGVLSERSLLIMSYALCGFANPGSLGIMIGGLGAMAPERRKEIVSLGLRSIIAGTLATCMTGAVAGILR